VAEKTVIMEEALIRSMAGNGQYVTEFPFLAALRGHGPGESRSGCCSKPAKAGAQIYLALKSTFASLGADKSAKLKQMLGADKVVIKYVDRNGRPAERTI
jgi:hypothetical protein